jgi:hypothetical protein
MRIITAGVGNRNPRFRRNGLSSGKEIASKKSMARRRFFGRILDSRRECAPGKGWSLSRQG